MSVYESVSSIGHKEKFEAALTAHHMFVHSEFNAQEQKDEAKEKDDRCKSVESSHHLSITTVNLNKFRRIFKQKSYINIVSIKSASTENVSSQSK